MERVREIGVQHKGASAREVFVNTDVKYENLVYQRS